MSVSLKTCAGVLVMLILMSISVVADEKPTFKLDWYGYVKLDGAYDQNPTNGNYAIFVQPAALSGDDDEQFNMTAKQTRFGAKFTGNNFQGVDVKANLEVDLYGTGSTDEAKAAFLIRHAYFTVKSNHFELLAGQTWDLISPLNPSTFNYPVLWGAGNTGYRRPQVRLSYLGKSGNTSYRIAAGAFRTIADDALILTLALDDSQETGSDDGQDAGLPSVQGIVDMKHELAGVNLRYGASGMYGRLKAESSTGQSDQEYDSWMAVGHLAVDFPQVAHGFGFSGEAYTGVNVGKYYGAVLNSNTIDGLESAGGWAAVWFKPAKKLTLGGGYGIDNPKNDDLSVGNRSKNEAYYGNIAYQLVPQVTIGLELSQWRTSYLGTTGTADNLRLQTSFVLNF